MTHRTAASETTPDATTRRGRARRRPWTLQARLMVTITGIVALILVIVGLATSAVLGTILQQNLESQLKEATNRVQLFEPGQPPGAARDVTALLTDSRVEPGFLLVLTAGAADPTGAYVAADGTVETLSADQVDEIVDGVPGPDSAEVTITDLGDYLVAPIEVGPGDVGLSGLPMTQTQATLARILSTVALVTAAGLVLLAIAIAVVIRVGLRPLRAVSDTATRVAAMPMAAGEVRINERVPDAEADPRTETGRVGAALNTLLDHVDESLEERQRNEERMRSFVADASHELRTPLASIRGYSELSLRALRQSPDARTTDATEQALERIQAQSLRMTTLVEDLLLLARLDEGQELVVETVDLTRVAIESVGDAQAAGPDHRWVLDVGDEPVTIAGDEARLHQVLTNLLANARTHTPAGTEVTVTLTRADGAAVLRVHDNGPGVDPAVADEMFERFSRADRSRTRRTGGTGLGLSIARAIVEAHHGTIAVVSRPGDTTFEVRLPASGASLPAQ